MDPLKNFDNPLQDVNVTKNAERELTPHKVNWFWMHPYLSALGGAGILLIVGAFIVIDRTSVQPQTSETRAWGGIGANFFIPTSDVRPSTAEDMSPEDIMRQIQAGPPFFYTPPTQDGGEASDTSGFDFNAFIAALSGPGTQGSGGGQGDSLLLDAYAFIPRGLISTSTPVKKRSPAQEALYQYGNEAGSAIQIFEESHTNMSQVVKDQIEDPQNPIKVAALSDLGSGFEDVGSALEAMEQVPSSAATAHGNLAKSYREIGKKLKDVPKAVADTQRVEVMLTYNTAVEIFVKNYVALATVFSLHDVSFAPNESGSVFMFTNASL